MLWGVYKKRSAVHVAPCTRYGEVELPHNLSVECECQPNIDYENHLPIVTHRELRCSHAPCPDGRKTTMKPKINERAMLCREFYLALMPGLRFVAERYGYALCVHGSLRRDIDLVAVPWCDHAPDPEFLVEALANAVKVIIGTARFREQDKNPELKPHGRKAWSIYLSHRDDAPYIDISVMPPQTKSDGVAI